MGAQERWREHVEQWRSSGLTAAEYGARAGVNPRTLTFWKWRLGREAREGAVVETAVAALVHLRAADDGRFELELAGGRRLRVPASFDGTALRRLLEVLEGAS